MVDRMSSEEFRKHIAKPKKGNKYRAKKTVIDGIKFDSQSEATYYGTLKLRKLSGDIKDFKRQVTYKIEINGSLICKYIADFVVYYPGGGIEVIDVKSIITANLQVFKLKQKLMKAVLGIDVKVVIP